MYSTTLSLTSALDAGKGVVNTPLRPLYPRERKPVHTVKRLGVESQGRSGRVRKISPPPGFDPRTVQPVANRYTEYAIPALHKHISTLQVFTNKIS